MLTIHPLVLGTGRRLFADTGPFTSLHHRLDDNHPTGVISRHTGPASVSAPSRSVRSHRSVDPVDREFGAAAGEVVHRCDESGAAAKAGPDT